MFVKRLDRLLAQKVLKLQLKKVSDKYKKMRYKMPPPSFNFRELADVGTVVQEESQLGEVLSKKVLRLLQTKSKINIKQ